jgi:hypothetical protein
MGHVAVIRKGLHESVRELQAIRERLIELKRQVVPPGTTAGDGDAEPDPLSEMGAVIECGLHDCLEPLIRDLQAAADREV